MAKKVLRWATFRHKSPPKMATWRNEFRDTFKNETYRASNSAKKIGITCFIQITQSKVIPIKDLIFKTAVLWTESFKIRLSHHFSTQNVIPYNFLNRGLAKIDNFSKSPFLIFGVFWPFLAILTPKRSYSAISPPGLGGS